MALEPIRPKDLPLAVTVFASDSIPVDNGASVGRGTPMQIADAGAPIASEAEAIAGVNAVKRMTPLTTRQVLDNEIAPAVLRAQAWAESPTPPDPLDPTSKSAKTWAGEASVSAAQAALYDGPRLNTVPSLIADTVLSYTAGPGKTVVAVGSYVTTRAEGFAYQVAASGAVDQHVTTAGGVKLYVLPGKSGYDIRAFGAPCNGSDDDTAAINMAVMQVAVDGHGRIVYPANMSVKILGTVWIVQHCTHDLNGCNIFGGGNGANYIFESAYLNAGVLTTTIGTPAESHVIEGAWVVNGHIYDCKGGFNFQNVNTKSGIRNVSVSNAPRVGVFDRCFYMTFEDIMHSGGTSISAPSFSFPSAANSIKFVNVTTTTVWCYHFVNATAISMVGCTQEGGDLSFKIDGAMIGLSIEGNYTEAVKTWMDTSGASQVQMSLTSNYFNYIDKVYTSGDATPNVFGTWDASNSIENINGVAGGFTYRGRMEVANRLNFVRYEFRNNDLQDITVPANWIVSKNTNLSFTSVFMATSYTDYRRKAQVEGGLIPLRFSGDTGPAYSGSVPFTTVTIGATTTIDTKISWQPRSLFAKFDLKAQDGNGFHDLFGDIYGENLKRQDADAMVMSISDNAGFLRISLTQTAPPFVRITGTVQICS